MITEEQLYNAKILIVDDEETSNLLLEKILIKAGYKNITSITDSTQACQLYTQIKPDLLILDLHMPKINGFEIMNKLKNYSDKGTYLPIIVISSDDSQEVRFKALDSGAKDFLNKPYDRIEVVIRIRNLIEVRILNNEIRDQNKKLEEKVRARTQELYNTQIDVIQRLARAVEYRDSETGMHIARMSHYASCLAAKAGLSMEDCELVLTSSPLHDIGKIGIPDRILCKAGKLDPEEWAIMKTHTSIGAEMLSGSSSKFLKMGKIIASTHHEKWDGSGYPNGLKGEEIPIVGRICGLCDVFDALTTKRPYKDAWPVNEAIEEIKKGRGTHFDPDLVDLFLKILPQFEHIRKEYLDDPETSS